MRQKKRVIGLLAICLLTAGIVSVYAAGSNPFEALDAQFENLLSDFGDMWDRINGLESNVDALEARIDALEAEFPPGVGPTYTVRIDTRDIVLEGGAFDVWNYVKNPSLTIERDAEGPLHNVEVQHLTMTIISPNEETTLIIHYPDGRFDMYYPNGTYLEGYLEGYVVRWDTTVHPGETALVFYSGWGHSPDYGSIPGIYQYTYELCVEYEGTIYNLVNTFEIIVHE